jgi:hypothetical protein
MDQCGAKSHPGRRSTFDPFGPASNVTVPVVHVASEEYVVPNDLEQVCPLV